MFDPAWISRQREFAADAPGAGMVGHPYGLISALEKWSNQTSESDGRTSRTASCSIVAPLSAGQVVSGMFPVHTLTLGADRVLRNMTVSQ